MLLIDIGFSELSFQSYPGFTGPEDCSVDCGFGATPIYENCTCECNPFHAGGAFCELPTVRLVETATKHDVDFVIDDFTFTFSVSDHETLVLSFIVNLEDLEAEYSTDSVADPYFVFDITVGGGVNLLYYCYFVFDLWWGDAIVFKKRWFQCPWLSSSNPPFQVMGCGAAEATCCFVFCYQPSCVVSQQSWFWAFFLFIFSILLPVPFFFTNLDNVYKPSWGTGLCAIERRIRGEGKRVIMASFAIRTCA